MEQNHKTWRSYLNRKQFISTLVKYNSICRLIILCVLFSNGYICLVIFLILRRKRISELKIDKYYIETKIVKHPICASSFMLIWKERQLTHGKMLPIFSHASTKAEHDLSSLSDVCMCVDLFKTPPPKNGISTRNSLISSPDLDSPKKFSLDWYLFLNISFQITLLQIYVWYYKTIWDHFKQGGLLLLQTTQPIRMQGQQ